MSVSLKNIIQELEIIKVSNEELFKLSQFEEKLSLAEIQSFEADEYIITPYYLNDEKIYELYAYELNICIVKKKDFNKYIKKKTGKNKIKDISNDIMELHNNCYIEIIDNEELSKKAIQNYIFYLKNSEQIVQEITKMFSSFDSTNLYFEVY